ncbi:MAG: twin-arginine translocation signal domain-containing protein, partial [Akkermansiaceae bacterium]|nr:twin-arginine translocation signal domain-containing protein [Akkermansiaceae bacterium]
MTTRRQFLATSGSTLAATAVTSAQSNDSPLFSF